RALRAPELRGRQADGLRNAASPAPVCCGSVTPRPTGTPRRRQEPRRAQGNGGEARAPGTSPPQLHVPSVGAQIAPSSTARPLDLSPRASPRRRRLLQPVEVPLAALRHLGR